MSNRKDAMLSRPQSAMRAFLGSEAAGGIVLIAAAAAALAVANSPAGPGYARVLDAKLGPLSLLHWINDGLMAVFFLFVGLEIKREFVDGHLATWADRRLPFAAAMAGMTVPAALYLALARNEPGLARGWAVPAATDIAFALGVLALLGRRVPASLKLFLTTVAIVDDVGAVAIIALAYTAQLNAVALAAAGLALAIMAAMNRAGVRRLAAFLPVALALWLAVLLSGIHATVAGVLAALAIPVRASPGAPDDAASPLHRLEHALAPWVAFGIVPVFGFANAGVDVRGIAAGDLAAPLVVAIAAGLFVGKQAGVLAAIRLVVAMGWAARPARASWLQLWGVALLCGVGFTMSLFIGALAFADPARLAQVKLGVLGGSLLSAVAGYAVLRLAPVSRPSPPPSAASPPAARGPGGS
jgi:Na+:H+ antiporter, NhaA family